MPAGSREGGRWTDEEGGGEDAELPPNAKPTQHPGQEELVGRSSASGNGHHYVPRAVAKDMKVSDDAKKVFESAKTGKLYDVRSNQWDIAHREYSRAVTDAMKDYVAKTGIQPENMTTAQAREFVTRVFESTDPRIKNYNLGIQFREIAYRLFRRSGRE